MEESSYQIKMSFNNNAEGFIIPVNPAKIDIKENGNGKLYDIVGDGGDKAETRAGEINVIKSPKLMEVSFESIFPAKRYPFVVSAVLHDPFFYINFIRKWKETKHPIRFIFAGHLSAVAASLKQKDINDINMPASIEKFEWKEVAGSPGDIEYSITLKEYKFYAARRVQVVQKDGKAVLVEQQAPRPDMRVRPETYTLKEGDNLWKVAKRVLGDDTRWKEIQKLNNITDAQLKKLSVGMVLKIPKN